MLRCQTSFLPNIIGPYTSWVMITWEAHPLCCRTTITAQASLRGEELGDRSGNNQRGLEESPPTKPHTIFRMVLGLSGFTLSPSFARIPCSLRVYIFWCHSSINSDSDILPEKKELSRKLFPCSLFICKQAKVTFGLKLIKSSKPWLWRSEVNDRVTAVTAGPPFQPMSPAFWFWSQVLGTHPIRCDWTFLSVQVNFMCQLSWAMVPRCLVKH